MSRLGARTSVHRSCFKRTEQTAEADPSSPRRWSPRSIRSRVEAEITLRALSGANADEQCLRRPGLHGHAIEPRLAPSVVGADGTGVRRFAIDRGQRNGRLLRGRALGCRCRRRSDESCRGFRAAVDERLPPHGRRLLRAGARPRPRARPPRRRPTSSPPRTASRPPGPAPARASPPARPSASR